MNTIPLRHCVVVLAACAALLLGAGCGPRSVIVATGGGGGTPTVATLEVDAGLTAEGITVTEKARQGMTLVLLIGSTKKDHDSSNYTCRLFDRDGNELSKTSFSIPGFAKGETSQWELDDSNLLKASKVVIRPLGK